MNIYWYLRWRLDMLFHWRHVQALLPRGGRAVEVGTWRGASAVRWLRQEPSFLGLVDPYLAKLDDSWEGNVSQPYIERVRRKAMRRVRRRDNGSVEWMRAFSTDAASRVATASLDLVYIDGDHCKEAVAEDLEAWWPKVKPGGVLVLDDHIGGRWWAWDVVTAAAGFQPGSEERREERGRWLVIEKAPLVRIMEREVLLGAM